MLIAFRTDFADFALDMGIFGREVLRFDPSDPRFTGELLAGPLDPGGDPFGGDHWADQYASVRGGNLILSVLPTAAELSAEEQSALSGYVKTIQALNYLMILNTHTQDSIPIVTDTTVVAPPVPFSTNQQAWDFLITLLEEGRAELDAGGAAFPFNLPQGFRGFDTPATFLQFNRALRARVAVYNGDFNTALTALQASFLNTGAPLSLGVYFVYSTIAGDVVNTLFDASSPDTVAPRALLAHSSILTDAQLQVGGARDQRVLDKVAVFRPSASVQGITDSTKFTIYSSNLAPIPIIKNEELILLRAEANIGLNQLGAAVTDIDLIRTTSGNLPAYSGTVDQASLLTELLYNKRYSLLYEGGHRWIDLRRYNRLNTLPKALPTHKIFTRFPFPRNDCLARDPTPAVGCDAEQGF
jgi:hypothetical protein